MSFGDNSHSNHHTPIALGLMKTHAATLQVWIYNGRYLCFPTQTMLSLLEETGPAVEGIFRKSGSIAECQDLKDKLDLGEEVDLRGKSIFVVCSVLKVFGKVAENDDRHGQS